MSELFPEDYGSLTDLPYALFDQILGAMVVLSYEELPKDERPPKRIWDDPEGLRDWFREVERRRDAKYGTGSGEPMQENEYARELRRRYG